VIVIEAGDEAMQTKANHMDATPLTIAGIEVTYPGKLTYPAIDVTKAGVAE
jgi:hypothetical protein